MIYLDYAATTPVNTEVADIINQTLLNQFANPSSIYQSGKHNRYLLNEQRAKLKELLHINVGELYFTSGATEANNWALISQAWQAKALGYGNHIVATGIEHPSVLETLRYLEQEGFEVTYLNPENNCYNVQQFINETTEHTIGWVAMWVNNEVGTILPIKEIGNKAGELVKWFHVDAVQYIGHQMDLSSIQATSISASGHKLYAPKGIGFLYYQAWDKQMILRPLLHGGGQEMGMRSGTENYPYICGLVKAFEIAQQTDGLGHAEQLSQYLFDQLTNANIAFERNGQDHIPYIINLYLPDFLASQLLIQMDLANIAISAGSACSAGSLEVSHVLKAYYPDDTPRHHRSIRLSFGRETTFEDLDQFIKQLKKVNERKEVIWHSQHKRN